MPIITLNDSTQLDVHPIEEDLISKTIATTKHYFENTVLEALIRVQHRHHTIIDIGANIGNHTVALARYTQPKQIYSYEPYLPNYEKLVRNVELNQLTHQVTPRARALGSVVSEDYYIVENGILNKGICELIPKTAYDSREIKMNEGCDIENVYNHPVTIKPLDDEDIDGRVTLMKIDAEGWDLEILRGAVYTILEHKPMIVIELNRSNALTRAVRLFLYGLRYTDRGILGNEEHYLFEPT